VVPASSQVEARMQSSVSEDKGVPCNAGVVVSHDLHYGISLRGYRRGCEPGRSRNWRLLGLSVMKVRPVGL
jgi:hypothetical protein